ncbi:zinc finger protein 271-like isoform X1 [Lytechinus pictus]|uniref:zinc finger protein 271-like isoform X1 n=2 Tax=Lytechinus pictus TaxID=7653 RepID=UPI0030B9C02D
MMERRTGISNMAVDLSESFREKEENEAVCDQGVWRIRVSETTMKGLREIRLRLSLSSYEEVFCVLLASYKDSTSWRHQTDTVGLSTNHRSKSLTEAGHQRTEECEAGNADIKTMANNEVTLDKEIKEEPYETYSIVKEEDLKDTLTEQNPLQEDKAEKPRGTAETSLEHGNLEGRLTGDGGSEALETHGQQEVDRDDSMVDGRSEEGWTEDNDDDKEMEVPQSSERTLICFIKEEPEDSTEGEAVGSNLHDTPSCSQQGGKSNLSRRIQEMSGDRSHGKHLLEDRLSEDDSYPAPNQVGCSRREVDRNDGRLEVHVDTDIKVESGANCETSCAGSIQTSPVCSIRNDRHLSSSNPARDKPFACSVCNRQFMHRSSLNSHMKTHGTEKPHVCFVCKERYLHLSSLRAHMQSHTGEKPYECSICDKRFSYSSSLRTHIALHTGNKPHQCSLCSKTFSKRDHLVSHQRTHVRKTESIQSTRVCSSKNERLHECSLCEKKFVRAYDLRTHVRIHTGEKPYACSICDKCFGDASNLKAHMAVHTGEKPHQCSHCSQTYWKRAQLIAHERTHLSETGSVHDGQSSNNPVEEKPFRCAICNKGFYQIPYLDKHLRTHGDEKPHECPVCKKRFLRGSNLGRHMRIHTKEKPYVCSICDKTFRFDSNLRSHMTVHTGKKPHQCSLCSKTYWKRAQLIAHERTHLSETGSVRDGQSSNNPVEEKPFRCAICNKGFYQISYLDKHLRTHGDEKPHECPVCKKRFLRGSNLGRHMRIHTKEKPYVCSICDKTFRFDSNLRSHMTVHTGKKPHQCSLCSKTYWKRDRLVEHERTHTSENPFSCLVCDARFNSTHELVEHRNTHTGMETIVVSIIPT